MGKKTKVHFQLKIWLEFTLLLITFARAKYQSEKLISLRKLANFEANVENNIFSNFDTRKSETIKDMRCIDSALTLSFNFEYLRNKQKEFNVKFSHALLQIISADGYKSSENELTSFVNDMDTANLWGNETRVVAVICSLNLPKNSLSDWGNLIKAGILSLYSNNTFFLSSYVVNNNDYFLSNPYVINKTQQAMGPELSISACTYSLNSSHANVSCALINSGSVPVQIYQMTFRSPGEKLSMIKFSPVLEIVSDDKEHIISSAFLFDTVESTDQPSLLHILHDGSGDHFKRVILEKSVEDAEVRNWNERSEKDHSFDEDVQKQYMNNSLKQTNQIKRDSLDNRDHEMDGSIRKGTTNSSNISEEKPDLSINEVIEDDSEIEKPLQTTVDITTQVINDEKISSDIVNRTTDVSGIHVRSSKEDMVDQDPPPKDFLFNETTDGIRNNNEINPELKADNTLSQDSSVNESNGNTFPILVNTSDSGTISEGRLRMELPNYQSTIINRPDNIVGNHKNNAVQVIKLESFIKFPEIIWKGSSVFLLVLVLFITGRFVYRKFRLLPSASKPNRKMYRKERAGSEEQESMISKQSIEMIATSPPAISHPPDYEIKFPNKSQWISKVRSHQPNGDSMVLNNSNDTHIRVDRNEKNPIDTIDLNPAASLQAKRFESMWSEYEEILSTSRIIQNIPTFSQLISDFKRIGIVCLASGNVQGAQKYFFFGNQSQTHIFFLIQVEIVTISKEMKVVFKAEKSQISSQLSKCLVNVVTGVLPK